MMRLVLIAMVSVVVFASTMLSARVDAGRIRVEASVDVQNGRHDLQLSIVNHSGHSIEISERSNPWGGGSGILVMAALLGDTSTQWVPLKSALHSSISSPLEGVVVQPGGTVSGAVSLDQRLPGLREALSVGSVVVFWYCRPEALDRGSLGSHGGHVVLSGRHSKGLESGTSLDAAASSPISVSAKAITDQGRASVRFSISNASNSSLKIERSEVPWFYSPRTVVVAAGWSSMKELETANPGYSVPYGSISLGPNETVTGGVLLDQRFVEIDDRIEREDVVVFWYFPWVPARNENRSQFGGFVEFPPRGAKTPQ